TQVGEGRVAGAEVVDGDPHAESLQALKRLDDVVDPVHDDAFGQLDLEELRQQCVVLEGSLNGAVEARMSELHGRDVDRNYQPVAGERLPSLRLAASFTQHP